MTLIILASIFLIAAALIMGCVIIAAWTALAVKEATRKGEKK